MGGRVLAWAEAITLGMASFKTMFLVVVFLKAAPTQDQDFNMSSSTRHYRHNHGQNGAVKVLPFKPTTTTYNLRQKKACCIWRVGYEFQGESYLIIPTACMLHIQALSEADFQKVFDGVVGPSVDK